ncbi:MAG: UTP--glucose-1-phosphate uridylyltransferase [Nitrospirae bacterium]|nr:UTP--glucose-1-phosphate uridylyltransferase [Nitrospirota bacterium]
MTNELIETILSNDDYIRNRSIESLLKGKNKDELLKTAGELEAFRVSTDNLYHKVRASLFLFVIYRFYLQEHREIKSTGTIPFNGIKAAFNRGFEESIGIYLGRADDNLNSALCSALAGSYYQLSFKYLLDQVRLSISQSRENLYLFNTHTLEDYPFSAPEELSTSNAGIYPVGFDATPVRLDPSHSGWSDIFFLGMDFPEGARVVNISVNLKIHGTEDAIKPPCECCSRYIEEPVIYLRSLDLKTEKKVSTLNELFNFGNDHLSLLKAGVVASGLIPPSFEGKDIKLKDVLHRLLGKLGGIEIVTQVNNIPKGSRLAVSTTLLATIITRLMRFSGQIKNQEGALTEEERRTVASRAILGEWLGGSGGGWQDSGGLWPGIKVITGEIAVEGKPEFCISRGCLLPNHNLFFRDEITKEAEQKIINSMVIVHGGLSQNIGPILEMVTEKYLLRHEKEWDARLKGIRLFDEIVSALKSGDMKELGRLTTKDWEEAIQPIIPWVNNAFTEDLIDALKREFKGHLYGFLMLGGASGGGMAFIVNPEIKEMFKNRALDIMLRLKSRYRYALPFAIDPVVYDFEFNHEGNTAALLRGSEIKLIAASEVTADNTKPSQGETEDEIKKKYGFDSVSHEYIKSLLKRGEIGLSKNRMPLDTSIDDVNDKEISHFDNIQSNKEFFEVGRNSIKKNEAAVVTFAGGMGSRWTEGAAVVKPINPFIRMTDKYRTFIEIHLAKSRKTGNDSGVIIPHVFTTSYLTHGAIEDYLKRLNYFNEAERIYLSPAKSIAHRVYPTERDLRFLYEVELQQKEDENVQKVQDSVNRALIDWAKSLGEGEDYSENKPIMRFNPPGHWYEIPNLLKNGALAKMITGNPNLKYLLCHNIDTMGAGIEPSLLGLHIANNSCLTFEVTPRRFEDRGGGLAKINGYMQLIEGLALPKDEDEYKLSYYNTLTNWVNIDLLLEFFGLDRDAIIDAQRDTGKYRRVIEAIQKVEKLMPTYVTIKNVKHVWGRGQEDIFPVAQFEKLWGDMTAIKALKTDYVSVSRYRGQQLKDPSQLDRWLNDGSFEYVREMSWF